MKSALALAGVFTFLLIHPATAQNPSANAPIYHVTVIERTVKAVNYMYRSGPTPIDFHGTVLLPAARGDAVVESRQGRTEIDARFEHLDAPQKFGTGYLTYVLWAISPDGHPKNLGELVANGSDKAKLHVTTDLQAFGLIVTAEPYSAVRQPSDVVVLENLIRPDTAGKIVPIEAKYELLPRGHYTYTMPENGTAAAGGPKVSMGRYEATTEVYEAQNAVQIADSLGAQQYAPDVMAKARTALRNAQEMNAHNGDRNATVMEAREAAERAEDARMIALERQHGQQVAQAQLQVDQERQMRLQAEAQAKTAQAEATANRQLLEQERAARQQAEAEAAAAKARPEPAPQVVVVEQQPAAPPPPDTQRSALRSSLQQQMSAALPTLDTPRGLVSTLPESDFRGTALRGDVGSNLARIATILRANPGLTVEVAGNCDSNPAADDRISSERAVAVRDALVQDGVPATWITAHSVGASRPLVANTSPSGRERNRRVEITIAGDAIGTLPTWDRTYSVVHK